MHDLAKWGGLTLREQGAAIGRRKRDSRELSARARPPTAHIARTVIEEDGDRLMEFTRAVSGATLFAPSLRLLRSLGAA